MTVTDELTHYLKEFRLPTIRANYEMIAKEAVQESLSYEQFLLIMLREEYEQRTQNKVQRFLRESKLPLEKTLANLDLKRLPQKVRQQISTLTEGVFLDHTENILVFGSPGTGKTHLLCAIAHELIRRGKRVLFSRCDLLVQELLIAKKNLELAKILKRFAKFDAILIDDIGYVQQSREEMEVLFTLLADRYEQASVMISSNLPFSQWDTIFKSAITAAAAVDRLVHHSIILELNIPSFRMISAKSGGVA